MSDTGPRFCPRCGTARVRDMPFCPQCGMNLGDAFGDEAGQPTFTGEDRPIPAPPVGGTAVPVQSRVAGFSSTRTRIPPVAFLVGLLIVALFAFGLLPRIQVGGPSGAPLNPAVSPGFGVSSEGPPAPILGLTIVSPTDGQTVVTKDVVVIGLAPPGLTVTRDVSFGLDSHTKADGTGHWAIAVGLDNGDNKLTFRLGDDKSTETSIRVTYTPPAGG